MTDRAAESNTGQLVTPAAHAEPSSPTASPWSPTISSSAPTFSPTRVPLSSRSTLAARLHERLQPLLDLWGRSLKLRTMTITAMVTGVMILIAGTFILTSVSDDLFSSKKDQVLADAARASQEAQRLIDASESTERIAMTNLMNQIRVVVRGTTASDMIVFRRAPEQPALPDLPQDFTTNTDQSLLVPLSQQISAALSEQVLSGEQPQYWQSVSYTESDGTTQPGLVVGSTLTFPGSIGVYELYTGYSLADTADTYAFIQQTLLLSVILLMLLIGVLVWTMVRVVFRPIRLAAETSKRLAEGHTDVRMPRQNDDQFDALSESFNDMADTLQSRITELDDLSTVQQRFVSDVSHELRTPLTTIRLAAEVLFARREQFDATEQRTVELLHTQVDRFETLLGDLLEISRYDAGQVTLEPEATNLARLTAEECDALRPISQSEIRLRADGGYVSIDVDPRRIRRIITNLVGNAIEHGEGRPVTVTIDSNTHAVAVSVRDSGIGMTEEEAHRAFDRFWRADPSRKRTLGGNGLGLAIAQEDAAVHGGVIEVWSQPGYGTNMRLTLPRKLGTPTLLSPLPLVPADAPEGEAKAQRRSVSRMVGRLTKWNPL